MTTTLELPEGPVEGLYYPTPVTPEEAFQAIGRLRKEARDEIERLIDWLDATDRHMAIDPDLEDGGDDEPSLGGPGVADWVNERIEDDLEVSEGDDEPDLCDEPALGAPENHVATSPPGVWAIEGEFKTSSGDQTNWAAGGRRDLEQDDADDEPSLGSLNGHEHSSQERWGAGDGRDLEQDPAESGIGDYDGLLEQVGTQDWQQGSMG